MWRNERVLRTNLSTNPSFTTNTTGYVAGGGSTLVRDASSVLDPAGCLRVSGGSSTDSRADITTTSILTAGNTYTVSADAITVGTFAGSQHVRGRTIWISFSSVSMGGSMEYKSSVATAAKTRPNLTVSIPTDATGILLRLYNGSTVATDYVYWNNVLIEKTFKNLPYFDGSTVAASGISYRWSGAANASASQQYLAAMISPPDYTKAVSTAGYDHWLCDSYDLTNYAFGITKIDNSTPEIQGEFTNIPQRNGVMARNNRSYGPGELSISMWVLGCEQDGSIPDNTGNPQSRVRRGLFERNVSMLIKLLGAQNAPITLTRMGAGASSDGTKTVVKSSKAFCTGATSIDTMLGRNRAEMVFTFTLVDAFWTDTSAAQTVTVSGTAGSSTSLVLNLTEMGDAPVDDSLITITGPLQSPTVRCDESGVSFSYAGNLTAGQVLTVDSGTWTARLNGTIDVTSSISHIGHSRFMYIPPRDVRGLSAVGNFFPTLTITGTGQSAASKFSVSYYSKYQVV